jgi:hypothetical protein
MPAANVRFKHQVKMREIFSSTSAEERREKNNFNEEKLI